MIRVLCRERIALRAAVHGRQGVSRMRVRTVVIKSKVPDLPMPTAGVAAVVLERACEFGDRPALIDGISGAKISFAELPGRVGGACAYLQSMGFKAGSVLAVHLTNCAEYALAFLAVAHLGGVITTSNPVYTAAELAHQWKDAGVTHVLTSAGLLDVVMGALAHLPAVQHVAVVGAPGCGLGASAPLPACGVPGDARARPFVIPYSSGTTGLPKGVVLTHGNITANVAQITANPDLSLDMRVGDNVLGVLPFFHIYGMVVTMLTALRCGSCVVTMPKFDPMVFLKIMAERRITWAPVVPPIILFLAKHPAIDGVDFSHLRILFSGAAPLDSVVAAAAARRIGGRATVAQGYGMTELSPVSHLSDLSRVSPGSVGRVAANCEARVVDHKTHVDVAGHGVVGEIWVRGPNVMKGYHNNAKATEAMITHEGWLKTGDLGYYDKDENFYIVDRLKELIKVKGFQVAPAELEAALVEDARITDAAVIGVPHARSGEAPKAFVVRAPNHLNMTAEDVIASLRGRLAEYKQIAEVEFVDSLPKSASGKILRKDLRAREVAKAAKGGHKHK